MVPFSILNISTPFGQLIALAGSSERRREETGKGRVIQWNKGPHNEPWRDTIEGCLGVLYCLNNVTSAFRRLKFVRGGWEVYLLLDSLFGNSSVKNFTQLESIIYNNLWNWVTISWRNGCTNFIDLGSRGSDVCRWSVDKRVEDFFKWNLKTRFVIEANSSELL